jgi:hypothetical protein
MQADPRVLAGTQNLLKHHFCFPFADLQQELKMVCLSASTCAKLLQAAGRLHSSLLGNLQDASKAMAGNTKPTLLDLSPAALGPAALGPADTKAAAERHARLTQASTRVAGAAWLIYDYCRQAGYNLEQSDADVVWDMQATPGTIVRRCYSPD